MSVLNVALIGSEEVARKLGKRGDVRDIESYVHKEERSGETKILSFLRPLRHPEKIRPFLGVLDVARAGLVEIKKVDAVLGEVLVALGCAGISHGHAVIAPEQGEWVDSEQVRMLLEQAGIGDWEIHEGDVDEHAIRSSLFELQEHIEDEIGLLEGGGLVLPVDQHFNVKGVGLVAIGYVQSGAVSKHDEIVVFPAGELGVVRSLQVMDDDVERAGAGDRVGVALRNLREQALHRGCMICDAGSHALEKTESSTFEFKKAPFQKRPLVEGDVVHASSDLQFVVGRISEVSGSIVSVEWESDLWLRAGGEARVMISQLDAPMRIMGIASNFSS